MIIVKAQGGLGNQLFQYAFGRRLALERNVELHIDTSLFIDYPYHRYGLDAYNIAAVPATTEEIAALAGYRAKRGRRHTLYNMLFADEKKCFHEKNLLYDERATHVGTNAYLNGYWQSEKYFENFGDAIRADLTLIAPLSNETKELLENIGAVEAVSLHVRRGVYASHPVFSQLHGTCGPEYYERALDYIRARTNTPHIFVFSDEPAWAQENLHFPFPTTYVSHTTSETPHEDLVLMSACKHHILANSTFSWWGAWLNPSQEKIVVGPQQWFASAKENLNTTDIFPASWVRL